jgi:hypothetical protein
MRLILIAAALSLPLAGCMGQGSAPTSPGSAAVVAAGAVLDTTVPIKPVEIADRTTIDEAVGIGATNAYTAASRMGAALARAGLIDKAKFKAADQRGIEAVRALRIAYLTLNATKYADAIDRAYAAVAAMSALTPTK